MPSLSFPSPPRRWQIVCGVLLILLVVGLMQGGLHAQTASPAPVASPLASPVGAASPTAVASPPIPANPTTQAEVINSLSQGELQEAINLLRANYIRPADVSDLALARATLSGVLEQLNRGAMLLPKSGLFPAPASAERMPVP